MSAELCRHGGGDESVGTVDKEAGEDEKGDVGCVAGVECRRERAPAALSNKIPSRCHSGLAAQIISILFRDAVSLQLQN